MHLETFEVFRLHSTFFLIKCRFFIDIYINIVIYTIKKNMFTRVRWKPLTHSTKKALKNLC